jgi:hypothetical protein
MQGEIKGRANQAPLRDPKMSLEDWKHEAVTSVFMRERICSKIISNLDTRPQEVWPKLFYVKKV